MNEFEIEIPGGLLAVCSDQEIKTVLSMDINNQYLARVTYQIQR